MTTKITLTLFPLTMTIENDHGFKAFAITFHKWTIIALSIDRQETYP